MKTLILTLDYELYGNGSGDVFKNIIEPTDFILSILRQYNIHISIFLEVVEYWRLKEEWDKGNKMGYERNPITAIDNQLRKAYAEGHDIQLHIHPQWVDSCFSENGWTVSPTEWRLSEYNRNGDYSLLNLFIKGRKTIEDIIRPIDSSYKCIAFRSGWYNVQPSNNIVKALSESDIHIDSSIFPGGYEDSVICKFDYRDIPSDIGYWNVGACLECQGKSDIVEMPIAAFPIRRITKYFTSERIKSFFSNRKSAIQSFESKTEHVKTSFKFAAINKIRYFFENEWQTWDYCLFSPKLHRKFINLAKKQKSRSIYVLVGHSKSFVNRRSLSSLISLASKDFQFKSISEICNKSNII